MAGHRILAGLFSCHKRGLKASNGEPRFDSIDS